MSTRTRTAPTDIAHYEGLIFKTASMYVPYVEMDFDDIVQVLRIKVWRALEAHDPSKVRTQTIERYVFMCVKNQCKDLVRRRRRGEVFLDDLMPVGHEDSPVEWMLQLATDHEQTFGHAEEEELLVPCTLTEVERRVIAWLYLDRTQKEVAGIVGLTRAEMERAMRTIRQKMADWEPSAAPVCTMAVPREPPPARIAA